MQRKCYEYHIMPRTAPADLPSQLGLDGLRPVSQTVQQGTTRADSCNTTTSAASSSTGSTATESQSRSRSAVESVDDEVQENEKHLPTETINRIQLMSGSLTDTDLATSTDRPPSSRLGSARFQVLPPIADKPTGMAA
ncbi:hypothetical protein EB796_002721 [Bugula neritina]|uniref:Uncharacterized protein n=1 Tax=Bugula neritina TaxID=10212 RepID=A0A7J7KLQ5_BUGNE|nr:hypothetical protein EB796_002721 [Bugula neritina]